KWYHNAPWTRFRKTLVQLNPICQVVFAGGRRCMNAAKVGHHLVSPFDDITRFLDPRNVVAICEACHGPEAGEDPDSNRTFVPTKWIMGARYPHEPRKPLAPGETRILAPGVAQTG